MEVRKRDGRLVDFDPEKIMNSIKKAALAVEGRDEDIQRKSEAIMELKKQLMDAGYKEDEAEEFAEEQFEGYIENGEYTEYDEEEAEEVTKIVVDSLDAMDEEVVDVEIIQDLVEKALMIQGHAKTAKEYILFRSRRNAIRDMNTSLMRTYEDITFGKSEDVELKRENANIDGDSAMGTMLRYGSEGAKQFNLLHLVSPEISNAHKRGDIHIHDLDFYSLTETCISENSRVILRYNGEVLVIKAKQLDEILSKLPDNTVVSIKDTEIYSNGKFVKLINIVRHPSKDKKMLRIRTKTTSIDVTDDHRVSIMNNGVIEDIKAMDLRVGMSLVKDGVHPSIFNIQTIDLIKLFGNTDNIVIYNTQDVINDIKNNGKWKDFCNKVGYKSSIAKHIRNGNRLTVREFIEIEEFTSIERNKLKLSYRRTRGNETIDAILKVDKHLGKFMGYMYSEGSVTKHESVSQDSDVKKACFTNSDGKIINDFNTAVSKVFNNVKIRDRRHNGELTGTHLTGYLAWELFNGPLGIKRTTGDIRMPDWIYSANEEFFNGFMGALVDGDGSVQADGYRIIYTTSSETLAKDLQKLLVLRGIDSNITTEKNAGTIAVFNGKECVRNYDTHRVSITGNLSEKMGNISSFKVSDTKLSNTKNAGVNNYEIISIETIEYSGYVYDMETENHHFSVDGVLVHNCVQIDLEKLFTGGFNTGHGFLREPGEIRSYAALAAIAIQSNQNDMHKRIYA